MRTLGPGGGRTPRRGVRARHPVAYEIALAVAFTLAALALTVTALGLAVGRLRKQTHHLPPVTVTVPHTSTATTPTTGTAPSTTSQPGATGPRAPVPTLPTVPRG